MSGSSREVYRTDAAADGALARGFDLSHGDWRDAFLAVADAATGEALSRSRNSMSAAYVGPVRDGRERWTLRFGDGRALDLVYDPHRAVFERAADATKGRG